MTLSEELSWRGFVNQTTYKDIKTLDTQKVTFYWGVDPSADSMHVGQLAMAIMIKHFVRAGHTPVLLVGGATGLIGDPDGKAQERELKSVEEIEKNKQGILAQYSALFDTANVSVVDNYEWFQHINYITFLRDVGKYFSMSQLLDREFIKTRIGQGGSGISYAEFSYSLIQGYDFYHLNKEKGVTLQVSGADQWGNALSGVELVRKLKGEEVHVWTAPLIVNKSTGKKFGKSEEGTVWLDEHKTSVYKFYQFWLNTDDQSVGEYIKIYTDITPDAYDALMEEFTINPSQRQAQKYLADAVTSLVHGATRAQAAKNVTQVVFGTQSIDSITRDELIMLAKEIPTVQSGKTLVEILLETNVVQSNGEAKRLLSGGAVSVDNEKVLEDTVVSKKALIKKGKNTFILVT